MKVVDYHKWNRAKTILSFITGFIALSFTGGLDHTEGEVHFKPALLFLLITLALVVNIQITRRRYQ